MTQVETLVALRLVAPQDRKAVEVWIVDQADKGDGAALVASLPTLATGEGWIWSPEAGVLERAQFPRIRTFDSSRPLGAGETPPVLPPIAGGELRAALASVSVPMDGPVKESAPDPAAIAAAEQRGYERGHTAGRDQAMQVAHRALSKIGGFVSTTMRELVDDEVRIRAGQPDVPERSLAADNAVDCQVPERKLPAALPASRGSEPSQLAGAANKILAVLDTRPPVWRTWTQVATLAGIKPGGGYWNAGRKALREAGLIETEGETVCIRAPSPDAPPPDVNPVALVELWAAKLAGGAARILRQLHERGPSTVDAIAAELGLSQTGGYWNAAWKQLRDNGLVRVAGGRAELTNVFGRREKS